VQVSERGSQDWWEGRRESAEAEDDGGRVWGWVLWGDVIFGWGWEDGWMCEWIGRVGSGCGI
jgi:hypothetical protein